VKSSQDESENLQTITLCDCELNKTSPATLSLVDEDVKENVRLPTRL